MANRRDLIPKGPRLQDLAGMADAVAWGRSLQRDLSEYINGRICWSKVDPGALLHGEPGTGKTMFAKALAATCELPLIETSYARWQRSGSGHLGDTLAAMHAAFDLARKHAPAILFIDEIEAVSSREIDGHNQRWYTSIITALNEEMNVTAEHQGVVIIAAANYPDRIDPALLRAGRLDTKIAFPIPAAADLEDILRHHLGEALARTDLSGLALATVGMKGADIERLVRMASRRARTLKRPLLLEDLFSILGEKLADIPRDYLERIAIHEAGHAIAAIAFKASRNVSISLFQLGKGEATTFFDPWIEAVTREVVERKIAVALAGRAAEQVLLGNVTAGAGGSDSSDLALANMLAFWAVTRWGLSQRDVPIWLPHPPEQIIATRPKLAKEAYAMIAAAYERALALVQRRVPQVRAIAAALMKRRALAHADIVALLKRPRPGAKAPQAKRPARRR